MSDLFGSIEGGGTKFVCTIATGPDDIRAELRYPTTTPDETLGRAIDFFEAQQQKHGKIAVLGIGSFGPIDLNPDSSTYGYVTSTPKPGWKDTDFLGRMPGQSSRHLDLGTGEGSVLLSQRIALVWRGRV